MILCQIQTFIFAINRNSFVTKCSKGGSQLRWITAHRIAFVNLSVCKFFAGQPSSPRGRTARAIDRSVLQDLIGVDDSAPRIKADRPDTTTKAAHLTIGDVDPTAIVCGKCGTAIRCRVPCISGQTGRRLARASNDARLETAGQPQAVGIGLKQRP